MNRSQLEHIIRAAGDISGDKDVVVIGSAAVFGQFPYLSDGIVMSADADVWPKNKPELADTVDGSIGELSPFHETFGYYGHGVSPKTAGNLPRGWKDRLVVVRCKGAAGVKGWCVEIHDLVAGKYVSGRAKDHKFNEDVIAEGLVDGRTLLARVRELPVSAGRKNTVRKQIAADFSREGCRGGKEDAFREPDRRRISARRTGR